MSEIEIFSEQTIANNKYPLKEISFEKPGRAGKRVTMMVNHQKEQLYGKLPKKPVIRLKTYRRLLQCIPQPAV